MIGRGEGAPGEGENQDGCVADSMIVCYTALVIGPLPKPPGTQ